MEGYAKNPSSDLTRWIYALLILGAVIGIVAAGQYMRNVYTMFIVPNPTGTILLDLAPLGETTAFQYHFDVGSGKLSLAKPPFFGYSASGSRDGHSIVVIDSEGEQRSVFVIDLEGGTHEPFSTSDAIPMLLPALSPDSQRVAFTTPPEDVSTLQYIEAWSIYVAERGKIPEWVAVGADPHWSPDGRFVLFLSEAGLRLFDTHLRMELLVWPLERADGKANMKIDVSDDGRKLAWSNTDNHEVVIASIESWEPFTAVVDQRISVDAFWPVFSPDGEWLAYEEVTWGEFNDNPRLVLYNIASGKMMVVADLSAFDQQRMFMTDWIQ